MIIMMVIFLLITFTSIALSVTTFNRLASEQSKVLRQLENSNNDITSALVSQNDFIQMNLSQRVLDLETNLIPLLTPCLSLSVQIHCGPGLHVASIR